MSLKGPQTPSPCSAHLNPAEPHSPAPGGGTQPLFSGCSLGKLTDTYQVIVWTDTEELPEVAEGNRCIGLEAKILEVVGGGEVAPFAAEDAG